ncbi:MAG: AAA family ATPase [Lachnospiraceae bacterium]|nr:AAA family ATPase [Lachnospiraceae bacterium]
MKFINACIGYDFTISELEVIKKEAFERTNSYIYVLLPYMLLFDKKTGTVGFTKNYLFILMCVVVGYMAIGESADTGEAVRYYKYITKAKELGEKILGVPIDIDPMEKVSANPSSKMLIKLLAGCGDEGQDEVIIDLEARINTLDDSAVMKDITLNEPAEQKAENSSSTGRISWFEAIVVQSDGSELTDNITDASSVNELTGDIADLDTLIGLSEVKKQIRTIINVHRLWTQHDNTRSSKIPMTMHMVFIGNPGTGKTTAARMIGKIYKNAGLLSKGQLVEVSRVDLVGKYIGHTAAKVKDAFDRAKGGVLFIDEAYMLSHDSEGGYGQEAIDMIVKLMEDNREDIAVIFAGYPKYMHIFLESNPGLASRIPYVIRFDDYSAEELMQILLYMCQEYGITCTETAKSKIKEHFRAEISKHDKNYGNGRAVRNYFEKMVTMMSNRMAECGIMSGEMQFLPADIPQDQVLSASYLQAIK